MEINWRIEQVHLLFNSKHRGPGNSFTKIHSVRKVAMFTNTLDYNATPTPAEDSRVAEQLQNPKRKKKKWVGGETNVGDPFGRGVKNLKKKER